MKALHAVLFSSLFLPLAFIPSCSTPTLASRQLISVTISPVTGTAQNGQVQFVATGYYSAEPYTITPLAATWGVYMFPQKIASTTQDGLATCSASGTTMIEAWVNVTPPGEPVCLAIDPAGRPCGTIGGSAQLICP